MLSELETNKKVYDEKYNAGYGVMYPESHIIRINKHILQHELKMTGGKIFDYGCGTGTHLKYFSESGNWECYGADISEVAVEKAKKALNMHVSVNSSRGGVFFLLNKNRI